MDHFTLEALPAQHGDCLMLHFGSSDDPGLLLIDGGPSGTWEDSLEPRLAALRAERGARFKIDLLMVSHIDDDHIVGVVDFTDAWLNAKTDGVQWPYPVHEIWHNSFERIAGDHTKVTASVLASVLASTGGTGRLEDLSDEEGGEETHARDAAKVVLASVGKGNRLRGDIQVLGIPKNSGFDGLVRPGVGPVPYPLGDEVKLHVAGPLAEQLDALRKKFAEDLPPAVLAAYVDESVPNLSSIVALASYRGKTILLTGDARGDYLLEGLEKERLIEPGGTLHVDVLKMQHHGSEHNAATEFFRRVTADRYVVSADGRFGNPDRATFEMLIEARGKEAGYEIHLTYPVASIDKMRRDEWERKRLKKIDKAKAKPTTKIPDAWEDETFAIAALLKAKRDQGYSFTVVEPAAEGKGARIDLLDPIGF